MAKEQGQYVLYQRVRWANPLQSDDVTIINRCDTLKELKDAIRICREDNNLKNNGTLQFLTFDNLVNDRDRRIVLVPTTEPDNSNIDDILYVAAWFTGHQIAFWDEEMNHQPRELIGQSGYLERGLNMSGFDDRSFVVLTATSTDNTPSLEISPSYDRYEIEAWVKEFYPESVVRVGWFLNREAMFKGNYIRVRNSTHSHIILLMNDAELGGS